MNSQGWTKRARHVAVTHINAISKMYGRSRMEVRHRGLKKAASKFKVTVSAARSSTKRKKGVGSITINVSLIRMSHRSLALARLLKFSKRSELTIVVGFCWRQ